MKKFFLMNLFLFLAFDVQAQSIKDAVSLQTGMINYTTFGVSPDTGANRQNMQLRWTHFWSKDAAMYIGYKTMTGDLAGRTQYQAGLVGYRLFPVSLGVPVRKQIRFDMINYDFFFKPYVESGFSLGRYLIGAVGEDGIYELSSETYSISLGGGSQFQFFDTYAMELGLSYEQIFGHSSPLTFGATHISVLLGFVHTF